MECYFCSSNFLILVGLDKSNLINILTNVKKINSIIYYFMDQRINTIRSYETYEDTSRAIIDNILFIACILFVGGWILDKIWLIIIKFLPEFRQ